ncbi:hypothetical protein BJ165DRAFT_1428454 [Panaeolus papilionaceus]|nr:hypothetical protein BJ165DRAFT_1428454 [Panaeolus papilionaceus]
MLTNRPDTRVDITNPAIEKGKRRDSRQLLRFAGGSRTHTEILATQIHGGTARQDSEPHVYPTRAHLQSIKTLYISSRLSLGFCPQTSDRPRIGK